YAFLGNGARAARVAGYSHRTARQTAHENLTKPYIVQEINKITPHIKERLEAFIDKLYAEWYIDIADIFNENNELKPVHDWPIHVRTSGVIRSVVKTEKTFKLELTSRFRYPEMIYKILLARELRWPNKF
ncbi:terminase small subunit, partial [Paenochrobactrum sp. BZR 588]|uniref:terminase small subunit n=1 Tax=unclassified Paenochrobactrum TaxID=2639760 RepID=UPI003854F5E9